MTLQEINIRKINDFGGYELLSRMLTEVKSDVDSSLHHVIDESLLYASMIFEMRMDLESDYIKYMDLAQYSRDVFKQIWKDTGCISALFMSNLHDSAISYVKNKSSILRAV